MILVLLQFTVVEISIEAIVNLIMLGDTNCCFEVERKMKKFL